MSNKLFDVIKEAAEDEEKRERDSKRIADLREEGGKINLGGIEFRHHPKNPIDFFYCYQNGEAIGTLNQYGEFSSNGDFPLHPAVSKHIESQKALLEEKFGVRFIENPYRKNRTY